MGFIREDVEQYLISSYSNELTGVQLARTLDIPERSARRYLAYYKERITAPTSRVTVPPQTMNAVVFDIETTDFGTEGYAGYLVCCSFLPLTTGVVETLKIDWEHQRDDRHLLEAVAHHLAQYQFHVGHNIASFDYNWLNSRLCYHGMPTLNSAYYFDTYQSAKSMALKTSKGLGNLIDYFGLDGVKTTVYRSSWSKVMSPHVQEFDMGLSEIVEHCELDVLANRELFNILHYRSLNNGRQSQWKLTKVMGNYWK